MTDTTAATTTSTSTNGAPDMDTSTPDPVAAAIAVTLSPAEHRAQSILRTAIAANVPVLLMGAPGTAKTALLESIAAAEGAYIEIVIASAQDPTTILGIPMPTEDRKFTEPTTPGWARRVNEAHAAGRRTFLFIDEVGSIPDMIAAPLLGVIQSRRADGWTLPADTRIIAAGNPPDLAAGGWALAPAMANRWVHVEWPSPVSAWLGWARAQGSAALSLVADYIEAVPTALLAVPTSIPQRSGPWASPRSWTNAARLIEISGDYTMAEAAVGKAVADGFIAYAKSRDVPTVAELLAGTRPLPERPDAFAMALSALADAVTTDTLSRTVEVMRTGIAIDPAMVREAAADMGRRGYLGGIAALVDDLERAGAALFG